MSDLAIRTEGLTKYYRGAFFRRQKEPALRDLTLHVPRGQVFGFLGPNGAGKTTTIRCLMDLIRPTEGRAWILGQSCREVSARERVGYLPDAPAFYSFHTAEQFLLMCARLLKIPADKRRERVAVTLEMVHMSDHAKANLGGFSRGMLQRVGIAQALLNEPDLLILDEPLVGLDPEGRHDLLNILRTQKSRGACVFFSSHILSDVEKLCDCIGVLRRGELLCAGEIDDLLDSKGIGLRVPEGHEELVQEFLAKCDGSHRDADGAWRFEFADPAETDEMRNRQFPDGISRYPLKESLEELFFRLTRGPGTNGNGQVAVPPEDAAAEPPQPDAAAARPEE